MKQEDAQKFPPVKVQLRDGGAAIVRPLRVEDAEALGDFYEATPREDFRFYCPHELSRAKARQIAAGAMDPGAVVLVLEAPGGAIGGYAWYRWQPPDAPTSTFGILIARPFQGRSAGKALMTRLLEIAKEVGPPTIALTVQQANPKAVALYRQMGFAVVREQMRPASPQWELVSEPEYHMERRAR